MPRLHGFAVLRAVGRGTSMTSSDPRVTEKLAQRQSRSEHLGKRNRQLMNLGRSNMIETNELVDGRSGGVNRRWGE